MIANQSNKAKISGRGTIIKADGTEIPFILTDPKDDDDTKSESTNLQNKEDT